MARRDPGNLFGTSLRAPPSNLIAEQAVLGAILANNRAYEAVAETLEPKHFADTVNGAIYRRIAGRILTGRSVDAVALKGDMENSGTLDEAGGTAYLAQLVASMVAINVAGEYARVIVDCWRRRELIEIGEAIVNTAFDPTIQEPFEEPKTIDGIQMIDRATTALSDLTGIGRRGGRMVTGGGAVREALIAAESAYRSGKPAGIFTGMLTVDKALDGLAPGSLTLIAGPPGSGKTALGLQMAVAYATAQHALAIDAGLSPEAAQRQRGAAVFEMEMTAVELGQRMAAAHARIPVSDIRNGRLNADQFAALIESQTALDHIPLRIHETGDLSMKLFIPKLRMHLQRQPETIVLVDHLLAMVSDDEDTRRGGGGSLNAATVSWTTRRLKALAQETGVAMLVITHTPRATRGVEVRRPTQSDVMYGGERDASGVVFVHRPIMFIDSSPPTRAGRETDERYAERKDRWWKERESMADVAEIIVAKNRQGAPGGAFRMRWDGPTTSLREWDETTHEPVIPGWFEV